MIDQILCMLGNISAIPNNRKRVVNNFDLVQILNDYLRANSSCFPAEFSDNVFFVVNSLVLDMQ
jgi:hypothetical protein